MPEPLCVSASATTEPTKTTAMRMLIILTCFCCNLIMNKISFSIRPVGIVTERSYYNKERRSVQYYFTTRWATIGLSENSIFASLGQLRGLFSQFSCVKVASTILGPS